MKTLQQMVQEEINRLMSSKSAKMTDGYLEKYEKVRLPFEIVMMMYSDYTNNFLSLAKLAEKYNYTQTRIKNIFAVYGLKMRSTAEAMVDKRIDCQSADITNGMGEKQWCEKWGKSRPVYYRLKRSLVKSKV